MVLSKRERVFKALELDGEPDKVPINVFGFEHTGTSFQAYKNSPESKEATWIKPKSSKVKYYITEQRFWNVDIFAMDPFGYVKLKTRTKKATPEYPDCYIDLLDGRIYKTVEQIETGLSYRWYVGGYYTTPEILHSHWDQYGRPSELILDKINYSPQLWEEFVDAVSPYFYPMVGMPINPTESLFNGLSLLRLAYYMRKDRQFIHEVMEEYAKTNIEIIKRLAEAGVDIIFFGDDRLFEFGDGELLRATEDVKSSAREFISTIEPRGRTNALAAFERTAKIHDGLTGSSAVVYFLTDGFELTTEDITCLNEITGSRRLKMSGRTGRH